jgi:hypothetical protein
MSDIELHRATHRAISKEGAEQARSASRRMAALPRPGSLKMVSVTTTPVAGIRIDVLRALAIRLHRTSSRRRRAVRI